MADRKAELEKKRQKLEELKKAREQKKKETQDKELVNIIDITDNSRPEFYSNIRRDMEDHLPLFQRSCRV